MSVFAFYLFAISVIAGGLFTVISRNPVHSVLWLILSFLSAAGLFVLLGAEFVAMLLVIVYVGAVAVLFLFVVMMLDVNVVPLREGFVQYLPVGIFVGVVMLVEMVFLITQRYFRGENYPVPVRAGEDVSNTEMLGRLLYERYLFQFEIAAIILLVAIVAAIALTMRRRPDTKYQTPGQQVKVSKGERLRVVSMEAEKR